jgi:RimJ/RimL family protein N-acetyltransferase
MVIESERLLLRALAFADSDALVRELNNFAIVRNTARIPFPYAKEDAETFLTWATNPPSGSLVMAIELKTEPHALQGIVSYEWSESKGNAELGYWLSEGIWGQGYGYEAAQSVVKHAFEVSRHGLMIACYHNENEGSARILRRIGFETTGPCTSYSKAQGREVNVTNMKLTRDRWRQMNQNTRLT